MRILATVLAAAMFVAGCMPAAAPEGGLPATVRTPAPTRAPIASPTTPPATPAPASHTAQPGPPSPASTPAAPTPAAPSTPEPTPLPTVAEVPSPTPQPEPYGMNLYRDDAFVSQKTAYWCVPAAIQTMFNIMGEGEIDDTRATQQALYRQARDLSTDQLRGKGAEPEGWANTLTAHGFGPYEVHVAPNRREAIQVAARQMRLTDRPVGLLVWRGAHSWVMSGFEATADPALTDDFKVTGIYVQDVWYPRISSIWGPSDPPDTLVPLEDLNIDYKRYRRPRRAYPDKDGQFVLIIPVQEAQG